MPLTNLDERQGWRIAMWLVIGALGLFLLLCVVPVRQTVFINTREGRDHSTIKGLELGIVGYRTEYNRYPAIASPPPSHDNTAGYNTTTVEGRKIMECLAVTDPEKDPRTIAFCELPNVSERGGGYSKERGLVDTWGGNGYIIIFDYDKDGKISDPEHLGKSINAAALIYSAGPDHDLSTWKDNVKSWDL